MKRATLLKEYEVEAKSHAVKAYIRFCLDEEDSFEDFWASKRHAVKASIQFCLDQEVSFEDETNIQEKRNLFGDCKNFCVVLD